jgi:hypothetical protein
LRSWASAALILSGPALGAVRSAIRDAFAAGTYRLILNAGVAVAALALVGLALSRLRTRRTMRLVLIASAIVVAVVSAIATASPSASQNAVERFHFIEYAVVILLWYRAVKTAATAPDGASDLSALVVPALAAVVVSAGDEWMQWFVPERVGEWKDILLNVTAIGAGILFSLGVDPPARLTTAWQPGSRRRTGRALALADSVRRRVPADRAHGTIVRDVQVGAFRIALHGAGAGRARARSWGALESLAAACEVRALLARGSIPGRGRLARARAQRGVGHRRPAARGSRTGCSRSTSSPRSTSRPTPCPPAAGRPTSANDARTRAGDLLPRDFVSQAEPLTILTWRPPIFWMTVAVLALIALGIGEGRRLRS